MKAINLKDKTVVLVILLVCLWIAVSVLCVRGVVKLWNNNQASVDLLETVDEEAVQEALNKADESMQSIYTALLAGSEFDVDGNVFCFGTDGQYDGYFDADDTDVAGYSYEITRSDDGQYILAIHNDGNTKYTEYVLSFSNDGGIVLTYPGMSANIILSY